MVSRLHSHKIVMVYCTAVRYTVYQRVGKKLKFRIATSTLRTVEKNGGIDSFLLNAFNKNLSSDARKYKKSISKASVQNNSKKD